LNVVRIPPQAYFNACRRRAAGYALSADDLKAIEDERQWARLEEKRIAREKAAAVSAEQRDAAHARRQRWAHITRAMQSGEPSI